MMNDVSIPIHGPVERAMEFEGDGFLRGEYVVEIHLGEGGAEGVEGVGCDLEGWGGQGVEGFE